MTETEKPGPGGRSSAKGIRIALILSLAVNLLFVGLIVGAAMARHRHGNMMDRAVAFGPLTAALTREDRHALRERFLQTIPDRTAERAATAADFAALIAALKADPWDSAAAGAALQRQGLRSQVRLEQGRDILLAHITKMTAAERHDFAARIEAVLASRWGAGKAPAGP